VRIIRHLGNYGASFERNVGEGAALKIKRGQNTLWAQGQPAIRHAGPLIRKDLRNA
jgi:hypothetical protein